jgi:hypothetical protein
VAHGVFGLRAAFPTLSDDLSALRHSMHQASLAPALAGAFFEVVLSRIGIHSLVLAALGAAVAWIGRRFVRAVILVISATAAFAIAASAFTRKPQVSLEAEEFEAELASVHPSFERMHLKPAKPLPDFPRQPIPNVVMVMLESVGKYNLEEHEAQHPGCRFTEWRKKGIVLSTVVPTASATHISLPSIFTSHVGVTKIENVVSMHHPAHPTLHVQEYFRRKGATTIFVSAHDERWLGLDQVTLRRPWNTSIHAPDFPADKQHRIDCGSIAAFDSAALARFSSELAKANSAQPFFGLLNLHNTHYPYVVERTPGIQPLSQMLCPEYVRMPSEYLPMMQKRYQAALLEQEANLGSIVDAWPNAVFLFMGDHGEDFLPGYDFGHAKSALKGQGSTVGFLFGPGIHPRSIPELVSGLDLLPTLIGQISPDDLNLIPDGIFEGRNVIEHPRGQNSFIFTGSHGVAFEFAALYSGTKFRYLPKFSVVCSTAEDAPLSTWLPDCARVRSALLHFLACQRDFYESADLSQRFFNPCFDMVEALISKPETRHASGGQY